MSDLLSQLNEEQRRAAACTEGPVMIIAGAGSGKTRTLTYRIAHLIYSGVDSFRILALTFTNKAAKEMKDRIVRLVGDDARNIWMGTFHSVFAKMLRAEATKLGYTSSFTIYDNDDSKSLLKKIVKSMNLDTKAYTPNYILNRISMAKSNLISPEDYCQNVEIQQEDQSAHRPMVGQIYRVYNHHMRNAMAMDFDDLLFNTNILLRDFPDVLLKYQNRFRHILVDEYQDTNYAQYLIVKKLAARYQNICVVGDDAQSIYGFRGANIQNILNFKRDYPNVQLFKLEQNYRSTKNIVNAANSIISNNKDQIQKEIWTDNAQGNLITLLQCSDERDEGSKVAESILDAHLGDNHDFRDFAILYRTNNQSRAIEEALRRRDIPYRIYAGISFYGRKEVKDVLAYLRLVINNHDDESLLRAIKYPSRGIGDTTLDRISLAANDNDVSIFTVMDNIENFGLGINSGIVSRIRDFVTKIKLFSAQVPVTNAFDLAKMVVRFSGIISVLREDPDPDNPNRIENIEELLNGVQEFCERDEQNTPGSIEEDGEEENGGLRTLDQFLQQVLLLTSEDKDEENADKVSLMTIHAAKGLEFPYVYVVGMEEEIFPSILSISSRPELEEERRLFYVAVTRAEQQLTLSYALMRYQYGNTQYHEISRFVDEIDPAYLSRPRHRQSSFPKVGSFPRAFAQFSEDNPQVPEPHLKKKSRSESKGLKKIERMPRGPVKGNTPSEINAIQEGMTVMHSKFGVGTVQHIEGEGDSRKALIYFEGVGEKQLMLKFAKLTIVNQ